MRRHDFLICYDISDNKRLGRIARYLERVAMRVQYSVFLFRANREEVERVAKKLDEMIDVEEDDLRIYRIEDIGIALGDAVDLGDPYLLI